MLKITELRQNVLWGIRGGVVLALVYSGWVAILAVLNLSLEIRLRSGIPVNALAVMVVYGVGGIIGGAIIGALRPIIVSRTGAALLGVVSLVPVLLASRIALMGFVPWSEDDSLVVGICALIVGIPGGLILRDVVMARRQT